MCIEDVADAQGIKPVSPAELAVCKELMFVGAQHVVLALEQEGYRFRPLTEWLREYEEHRPDIRACTSDSPICVLEGKPIRGGVLFGLPRELAIQYAQFLNAGRFHGIANYLGRTQVVTLHPKIAGKYTGELKFAIFVPAGHSLVEDVWTTKNPTLADLAHLTIRPSDQI